MATKPAEENGPLLGHNSRRAPGQRFDSDEEERAYEQREKIDVNIDDLREQDDGYVPPFSWRKLWLFTGPGFLMSIAFLDPGNLEGDLQAGAIAGYSLLWLLLWSTVMGLIIQLLAARLGVATGYHLAELCREEYPFWARIVLWLMAEIAIIGADIQEVIGSAIALKILTNGILPLWAGVLITALDWFQYCELGTSAYVVECTETRNQGESSSLVIEAALPRGFGVRGQVGLVGLTLEMEAGSFFPSSFCLSNRSKTRGPIAVCFVFLFLENYGVRKLEALFGLLITIMALSFAWMFGEAKPNGKELLLGLLIPRINSNAVRQAVGIVGCIIMPHNIFLHSALVQSRMVDTTRKGRVQEALNYFSIESSIALLVSFMINLFVTTVFAKGFYGTKEAGNIGLVNAGTYLQQQYGGGLFPILYIWAIGLLSAGQSSTITGTYAGQFVMAGFLNLRIKKWMRALITRSFAIVPTVIVALIFDTSEDKLDVLNEWLNVLQSIQIPFALIPLLCLVSKEQVMGIFKIGRTMKRANDKEASLHGG
eukprot:Gb_30457 [translate_table: standard]